ncbi:MAG: hypothetical protein JW891_05320 [Candidatus Lokiarchaeota archaeon]|nr:hypothetical protein [Candidatus Lokiarchaeota archaeon]
MSNTRESYVELIPLRDTLTNQTEEELRHTESELDIQEPELLCVVHKGPIRAETYVCPHCKAFYCRNCLDALKNRGETCWVCHNSFE